MAQSLRSTVPMLLLLAAGGCTQDPIDRPGTWQPIGANDHNLRAMVANPNHLERGEAAHTERGNAAANAATRLFTERRRPLPNLRASTVGGIPQQATDPPLPGLGGGGSGASR